jgi:tetratricopeptide (TPR) repeat protein
MVLGESVDTNALSMLPLTVAGVSLKQANGSLIYSNMRLLRISEPWICKGATHEAWTCPDGKTTTLFQKPVINDISDGGCKSDKFERDERLLLMDISENPTEARSWFYLGQTYLCLNNWPKAIETLKHRVQMKGWEEENYMAYIYLGDCYKSNKEIEKAIFSYMNAWQIRPHRTEAPLRLITYYRLQPDKQFLAMIFMDRLCRWQLGYSLDGKDIGKGPENEDVLFVSKRDMEFTFWEELMILSYYTGYKRPAWAMFDEFDLNNTLNWHEFNGLFGHLHWYDWQLKPRKHMRLQLPVESLPWAKEEHADCWQPFNPSLRKNQSGTGYLLNLRYANYFTKEAKVYEYRAFWGQVLTRNLMMEVDKFGNWLNPVKKAEIKIDPKFKQDEGNHIRGVEDCRLVVGTDAHEYMGTSRSYSSNGNNRIFHVYKKQEETAWSLKELPLPPGVNPDDCQKNWLGFRHEGKLHYIYSFSPFRICDETGAYKVEHTWETGAFKLREYRGSAGPVPWSSTAYPREKYLCAMHKVYIGEDGRRYYHRFMTLDESLKPSRISCLLRMSSERVEYWSGLCQSIEKDSYWLTYGVKDSEAYIAELQIPQIEGLMFYDVQAGSVKKMEERIQATMS